MAAKSKSKKKYPPEIVRAARVVRDDLLQENAKAPGAKQVLAVAKAVGDRPVSEAAGLSKAKLRAWAVKGERPNGYEALRGIVKEVGDPFVVGRRAAAILVALDNVRD